MKNFLLILFAVVFPAYSAEFTLNGSLVKSSIYVNEFKCQGYSILVKEDRFPLEVDYQVPAEVALQGFYGNDLIVGATAFVKNASIEHKITIPIEKYQKKGNLLRDGRVYIPSLGYCLSKNTFLLSVWSGGNCTQCELLIKYQINPDGSAREVGLPSQKEFLDALGREN